MTTTDGTPYWLAVARQIGLARLAQMCPGFTPTELGHLAAHLDDAEDTEMPMPLFTTTFDPRHAGHRTVSGWRADGPRAWDTNARAYAHRHGEAKVLLADGRVKRFFAEEGKIRQRTYRNVIIVRGETTMDYHDILNYITNHYDDFPNFDGRTVQDVFEELPDQDARYDAGEEGLVDLLNEINYR